MNDETRPDVKDNTALLVIDVQQGLFERSRPIYRADQMLENINKLIHEARKTGTPVIFIQHENEKTLMKDSPAWQLHPQIRPLEKEPIIHKRHGNAFKATDLHHELEERGVREVVITGLVSQGCVKATSLGAIEKGYKVILVSDGHSTYSKGAPEIIEKWNNTLGGKGVELQETKDVDFDIK